MPRKQIKRDCVYLMMKHGKPYRWIVKVTVNNERKYIGCFKTSEEARAAYKEWKKTNE